MGRLFVTERIADTPPPHQPPSWIEEGEEHVELLKNSKIIKPFAKQMASSVGIAIPRWQCYANLLFRVAFATFSSRVVTNKKNLLWKGAISEVEK